jgi:hypothetical protein
VVTLSLTAYWKFALILVLGLLSGGSYYTGIITSNLYLTVAGILVFAAFLLSLVLSILLFIIDRKYPAEKYKFRRGLDTTLFILCSIIILCIFYYLVSLYPIALDFMKEGVTAAVSAIIGGLACESILRLEKTGNDNPEPISPTRPESVEPLTPHEATPAKSVDQIKLELEVDKLYLTVIGLAFTVESVFIGLYGKSLISGVIDMQFLQIAAISFMFIVFMIIVWCDYHNKKKEVEAAFNR